MYAMILYYYLGKCSRIIWLASLTKLVRRAATILHGARQEAEDCCSSDNPSALQFGHRSSEIIFSSVSLLDLKLQSVELDKFNVGLISMRIHAILRILRRTSHVIATMPG